ncbi:MAG: ribosome-associated translation inhibitor RaiA [Bacteroidota bacterium]
MNISIQYVKMPESDTLTQYCTARLEKLTKKYDWITQAQVFFKYEKEASGMDKICEIELSAPGPRIYASSKEKNFEMAVKETLSDLNKQLKKRKALFTRH